MLKFYYALLKVKQWTHLWKDTHHVHRIPGTKENKSTPAWQGNRGQSIGNYLSNPPDPIGRDRRFHRCSSKWQLYSGHLTRTSMDILSIYTTFARSFWRRLFIGKALCVRSQVYGRRPKALLSTEGPSFLSVRSEWTCSRMRSGSRIYCRSSAKICCLC